MLQPSRTGFIVLDIQISLFSLPSAAISVAGHRRHRSENQIRSNLMREFANFPAAWISSLRSPAELKENDYDHDQRVLCCHLGVRAQKTGSTINLKLNCAKYRTEICATARIKIPSLCNVAVVVVAIVFVVFLPFCMASVSTSVLLWHWKTMSWERYRNVADDARRRAASLGSDQNGTHAKRAHKHAHAHAHNAKYNISLASHISKRLPCGRNIWSYYAYFVSVVEQQKVMC